MTPDKNRPSAEWIAQLRARFPTEREIDRVLTRKMERRAGPGYSPQPLERLVEGVRSLIAANLSTPFEIADARWLSGGASKLQMAFSLSWTPPGAKAPAQTPMVLRMEPSESIVETSRLREFQLIRAMEGTVPVPPVYWCDAEGTHLPYPALIYGFAQGVAKPSDTAVGVSGVGTQISAELRAKLAPQFLEHFARIHNFDFRNKGLDAFEVPEAGTTQCAEWNLNWWERVWEEDSDEDVPLVRLAIAWLRQNLPITDRVGVVHADYRVGNFLFTEHDAKISAWLDWELGLIGDRHQDLAWTMSRAFGGLAEDGKTFLTCALIPEQEFIAQYEKASGLRVDPKTLRWYQIYNGVVLAAIVRATGFRIALGGKTHQDVLTAWLVGISAMALDDLRSFLEETH